MKSPSTRFRLKHKIHMKSCWLANTRQLKNNNNLKKIQIHHTQNKNTHIHPNIYTKTTYHQQNNKNKMLKSQQSVTIHKKATTQRQHNTNKIHLTLPYYSKESNVIK